MAQRVNVVLVDDIDGSEATETIKFGLDGQVYEIDLNSRNAAKLRTTMEKYVTAARKPKQKRQRRNTRALESVTA